MAAATCPPAYDWAKNSQGMDPCAVASKLINVCDIDIAPLMQIARDTSYPPPTTDTQTICTCSGPVYALVSACADCQYGLFDPWNVWSQHCSHIFETFFLHPPVTIPTWASQFNIYVSPLVFIIKIFNCRLLK
ncbi:hypothetical protein M413DRAFT_438580 [Hebeloma cylindrosporum]|uniref:Uncharacterized protein n=1 Tax=Hebeloma cylindrosporum TaxID=76867 RepID=A0A0C3CZ08_HEBCY|nr:hypothetical protein M413DRAFT_438580 [Hebeloma cylindrosporum h7]